MTGRIRYFVEGQPQHLVHRGHNKGAIFAEPGDYRYFMACLKQACDAERLAVHAYVLMTNHIHLLATPETAVSLPRTLQSVGRRYTEYFNRGRGRTGTLWEGRYRTTLIDSDRYLLTCMRYIELNPVRAGMVAEPADYPWSSHRGNAAGVRDPLLSPHPLYLEFGRDAADREAAYRALFRERLTAAEIDAIRQATNRAWALGDAAYRQRMAAQGGPPAMRRQRGRPSSRPAQG